MFCLHVSNRTENLLAHLAAVFAADEKRSIFAPEIFLVQSQGIERLIGQFLAGRMVCWSNYQFFSLVVFVRYLATTLGLAGANALYERDLLAWRLEALLRRTDLPALQPLNRYLHGDQHAEKRLQLARQLANLFDQYQLMRPEMLESWQNGRVCTSNSTEIWQMALWNELRRQVPGAAHRGEILRQLIAAVPDHQDGHLLPQRVSIFGLHSMPPLFLQCLTALATRCDVHLYLLSPCRQYWLDAVPSRQRLMRSLRSALHEDWLADIEQPYHPLLVSLGQQGRDFQKLLLDTINPDLQPTSYHFPVEDSQPTLLQRLQADILLGERPLPGAVSYPDGDASLRLVSCHSRWRELAVLKDHLLAYLHDHPAAQLRDLIVMAPDIQQYSALIAAVFHDISHAIADRSLQQRNPHLAALLAFIRLAASRCGWSEVFDVLALDPVYPAFGLVKKDLDSLRQWTLSAGVRWGLSAEHRQELGLPAFPETSWQAGLERMLMGFAIDSEEAVSGVYPFVDIEGSDGVLLGGLWRFLALLAGTKKSFAGDCTLADWSMRLQQLAAQLLGGQESQDYLELRQLLAEPAAVPAQLHGEPTPCATMVAWLASVADECRGSSGFLRGQLTFCSLLPMRSIPFQAIFILGLNDGEFPRHEPPLAFNLLREERRAGDRSLRDDDRYQFLEALLAARECLYVSYVGQSAKKGDVVPPSVVVSELLETLQQSYGVEKLLVQHPLHPFDRRYFSRQQPELFSYDSTLIAAAGRMRQQSAPVEPWWQGQLAYPEKEFELASLLRFFAHPQRFFLRDCLHLSLSSAVDLPEDSEPFQLDALQQYLLAQELLPAVLHQQQPDELLARFSAAGRWPLGIPGTVSFHKKIADVRQFASQLEQSALGTASENIPFRVPCGPFHCTGQLTNCFERGLLLCQFRELRGGDLLQAWFLAQLLPLIPGAPSRVVLLCTNLQTSFQAGEEEQPELARLAASFLQGSIEPSLLLVEASFAYVQQLAKKNKHDQARQAAERYLRERLEKGYEPELALLYRHRLDQLFDAQSAIMAEELLLPVYRRIHDARS